MAYNRQVDLCFPVSKQPMLVLSNRKRRTVDEEDEGTPLGGVVWPRDIALTSELKLAVLEDQLMQLSSCTFGIDLSYHVQGRTIHRCREVVAV